MSKRSSQQQIAAEHEPFIVKVKFSDGTIWETCKKCSFGTPTTRDHRYTARHFDTPVEVEPTDFEEGETPEVLADKIALDAQPVVPQAGPEPEVEVENEDGTVSTVLASELQEPEDDAGDDPAPDDSEMRSL
jgi:hypothetical protein